MTPDLSKDELGDRMKAYEAVQTAARFEPGLPVYARIDGRGFSKFTRTMRRPYDQRMSAAMIEATCHLVQETHALIGYTQSDEISLIWQAIEPGSSIFFDGKVAKMTSVLAAMATAAFTHAVLTSDDESFRDYAAKLPHFDARVLALPSQDEAANMLLWRTLDGVRNAVQGTAYAHFSHRSLHGMGVAKMRQRLTEEAGIVYEDYPAAFRLGSFVRRQTIERTLTSDELSRIPEKARPDEGHPVIRSLVGPIAMPEFLRVANRTGVIFNGEAPEERPRLQTARAE